MCCWNLIKKALGLSKKGAGGGQDDIDKAEYTQTGKEDDSTIVIPDEEGGSDDDSSGEFDHNDNEIYEDSSGSGSGSGSGSDEDDGSDADSAEDVEEDVFEDPRRASITEKVETELLGGETTANEAPKVELVNVAKTETKKPKSGPKFGAKAHERFKKQGKKFKKNRTLKPSKKIQKQQKEQPKTVVELDADGEIDVLGEAGGNWEIDDFDI